MNAVKTLLAVHIFFATLTIYAFGHLDDFQQKQAELVGTLIYKLGTHHELVKANTVKEWLSDGTERIRVDPLHLDTKEVIVRFDHDEGKLLAEAINLNLPILRSGHRWFDKSGSEDDRENIKKEFGGEVNQINGNIYSLDLEKIFRNEFNSEQLKALYVRVEQQQQQKQKQSFQEAKLLKATVAEPLALIAIDSEQYGLLQHAITMALARELREKEKREAHVKLWNNRHERNGIVQCPLNALKGLKVWNHLVNPKIRIQGLPKKVLPYGIKLTFELRTERGVHLQSLIQQLEEHGYQNMYIPCNPEEWKMAKPAKGLQLNHRGERVFMGI